MPINGIESNPIDAQGARVTGAQRSTGRFNSVFDGLSAVAGYAGPVAASTMYYKGNYRGGDIVSAAVNSTAGYPGSNYGAASPAYYRGAGMQGLTKANVNVNYPQGNPSALMDPTGVGDPMAQAQDMLAAGKMDNVRMIALQMDITSTSQHFTGLSNVIASKDNMQKSMINNLK